MPEFKVPSHDESAEWGVSGCSERRNARWGDQLHRPWYFLCNNLLDWSIPMNMSSGTSEEADWKL
jgi:hypothetical protein